MGENDDGFAGLTVVARQGPYSDGSDNPNAGKPIDTNFDLHSQLPDLSTNQAPDNPPADARYTNESTDPNVDDRIFTLDQNDPTKTIARNHVHHFTTSTTIYKDKGNSTGFSCTGMLVLGPGNTYSVTDPATHTTNTVKEWGNRWALDCGEGWVGHSGGKTVSGIESTHFWIDNIQKPGSGYWEVQVGQNAPYSTDYSDSATNAGAFTSNPKSDFTVTNGVTQHVNLIWHPAPKHNPDLTTECSVLDVTDGGGAWINGKQFDSGDVRTALRVSDSSGQVLVHGPNSQNDFLYFNDTEKVWKSSDAPPDYIVKGVTLSVQVYRQYNHNTGNKDKNGNWIYQWDNIPPGSKYPDNSGKTYSFVRDGNGNQEAGNESRTHTCYSASCSVQDVIGDMPGGHPSDGVVAGTQFKVKMGVTNNGPLTLSGPTLNGVAPDNLPLNENDTGTASFTLTAPNNGARNYPVNFTLSDTDASDLSASCSVTVPVYDSFTLEPHVDLDPNGTAENLSGDIHYDTGVINHSGSSISAPSTSSFTVTPYSGAPPCSSVAPVGSNGPYAANKMTYTIGPSTCKPASVNAGDQYCAEIDLSYNKGLIGPGGDILDTGVDPNTPLIDKGCLTVINEPYFKTSGGGISARSGLTPKSAACPATATNSGLLAGWNDNADSGLDRGAGSQLSALALIKITGVASAQGSAPTSSPPGTGLTFGNNNLADISTDIDSPSLGGNFGGSPNCGAAPIINATSTIGGTSGVPASPGSYKTIGNLKLTGGTVNSSGATSIQVNGNVYITGDITYGANPSWTNNNGNLSGPSLVIVATGNIYIAPGVKQLDGMYYAQPKDATNGGTIYTCTPSSAPPAASYDFYNNCNKQLLVNGAFVAGNIKLERTFGSLRDEAPTGGTPGTSLSKNGKDYTVCLPTGVNVLQINDENKCFNDGNSVSDLEDYTAVYPFNGLPAGNNYTLTIDYKNFPNGPWPPPASTGYNYKINIFVSGKLKATETVPPDGSSFSVDLGSLPADPLITISGYNNQWVPYNGNPFAYDPNFEMNKLTISQPGTPGGVPSAPACSNKGVQMVSSTCAAEVFRFSPEIYLQDPAFQSNSNGAVQYDSITSLPPVL